MWRLYVVALVIAAQAVSSRAQDAENLELSEPVVGDSTIAETQLDAPSEAALASADASLADSMPAEPPPPPKVAPAWPPLPPEPPKDPAALYAAEHAAAREALEPPRALAASTTTPAPRLTPEEIEEARGALLYEAARHGDLAQVKELLKQRALINYESREGWTPLMVSSEAAMGQYREVTKELLANRADPDFKDDRGRSVLYMAAKTGDAKLLELLDVVHDKNAGDQYAVSPLNVVTREDKAEAVRVLLRMGANPHHPDSFGGTAYMEALNSENPEIRRLFGVDKTSTPVSEL